VYVPFRLGASADGEVEVRITRQAGPLNLDNVAVVPSFVSHDLGSDGWGGAAELRPAKTRDEDADTFAGPFFDVGAAASDVSAAWDLECAPRVGDSYRFALRARAAPDVMFPALGIALSAYSSETHEVARAATRAILTSSWSMLTVPLDVQRGDVTRLRAEIELPADGGAIVAGPTFNPLVG
jgi:hypothetical protein